MRKYTSYLFLSASIAVGIILFLLIDLPKIQETKAASQELSGIKTRLAGLSAKSAFLQSFTDEKLASDYKNVENFLPDGKDAPSILRVVDAAASRSGVTGQSFDFTPGKISTGSANLNAAAKRNSQTEIPVRVAVSGSTAQIMDYLKIVTAIGRVTAVKELNIDLKEGSGSAQASFNLSAYYLWPPEESERADNPLPELKAKEKEVLSQIAQREVLPAEVELNSTGKTDLFK